MVFDGLMPEIHAGLPGCTVEVGYSTTGLGSTEVKTKLKRIVAAIVEYVDALGAGSQLSCDKVITNGSVTVHSEGAAAKEFSYIFIGY
ncbi:unnamed protein product [marine sediment metagenome]|uniref:Uncharacterized protein n=1 Tax=marine sediment metagenome TaxID=412755 RepID=X0UGD3_9ZZZZ